MKKTVLTLLTILCFLLIQLLTGINIHVKASPDVIHVPTDYPTIQEAINHANPGDTILVHNQTYHENIFINKSVSLIGEDRETTIIDGGENGSVILVTANNVNISGFTIQNSGRALYDSGILIDHSSGNNISHNTITNNYHGIYLSYSRDNTISNNNISLNRVNGISLDSSDDNNISNNNISSNRVTGIRIYSSSDNLVSDNNISSNDVNGIRFEFSSGNTISGNTISNNDYGIRIYSSSGNLIYHNNFNNTDQVRGESINIWDDGYEGNYWSDHTDQDLDKDGIGDTPYVIDEKNQDNHPLMGRFSNFKILWKGKAYHTTIICNSTISNFKFEIGKETGNRIINFDVTSEDNTVGFCRIAIPIDLINYPPIVLINEEEIAPTILDIPNENHTHLYFTYLHNSHITLISSKLLHLYKELHNLNSTYHTLLANYSQLLASHNSLSQAYQQLLQSHNRLNASYQELNRNYTSLLTQHTQNIQNLTYIITATTAIFIIAITYLSTQAHKKESKP